jgi:hypothetical protein
LIPIAVLHGLSSSHFLLGALCVFAVETFVESFSSFDPSSAASFFSKAAFRAIIQMLRLTKVPFPAERFLVDLLPVLTFRAAN